MLRVSRCPIYLPRRLGRRPVWEVLAVGVLALDLMGFGWGFHSAADPELLDYVPPVVEFLKQDQRILSKRLGKWGEGDTGVTIVKLKQ